MPKRVLLVTRDLMFRAKLQAVVVAAAAEVAADETSCDIAVIEVEARDWEARIRTLVARGTPVLAFGSHVRADQLRVARDAGAEAVPNSQVEQTLRALLA